MNLEVHKYYTIKLLAKKARLSPMTIAFKISKGEIEAVRIAGRLFIAPEVAGEFIENLKNQRTKQEKLYF